MVADDLIERAKGLVHQQQCRIERESARDRSALLHAARKLPRELAFEPGEIDQGQITLGALPSLQGGKAHDLEWQHHVLLDGPPWVERRRLENVTICTLQPRLLRAEPLTRSVPSVGCSISAIRRSSVVFPQPDGPMKETNSPSAICKFTREIASTLPSAVSKVSETSRTSTANGRPAADFFGSATALSGLCIGLTTWKSPRERADARAPLSSGCIRYRGRPRRAWHVLCSRWNSAASGFPRLRRQQKDIVMQALI